MEKWFLKNKKGNMEEISKKFGISPLVAKVLINRDLVDSRDIDMYLNGGLENLHDPFLMKDIEKAANIIVEAIEKDENIIIAGDYDQDGNSSVLTLINGLKRCGKEASYVIPNRIEDGYGINERIVEDCKSKGVDLIVTCDNGISEFSAIDRAKELGMKIIVTDHHDIPYIVEDGVKKDNLLGADAVVNPKRSDCDYPFDKLCGAGVAFKLVQVVYSKMGIDIEESYKLLEFVAMATVCDVVDLVDENRIIVKEGLKRINTTDNIGLKSLIEATGLKDKTITPYHLGFIIGPCINASGRLESADLAVELLLTEDESLAKEYAKRLYDLNDERKELTRKGYENIVEMVERENLNREKMIISYFPDIHESIVGIIAGRIKDKYNKPTIVFTDGKEDGTIKGSARSIDEYNMYEKINEVGEYLITYGGHPMAAGLSLEKSNLDIIYQYMVEHTELTAEDLAVKRHIDMHLPLKFIDFKLIEELELLAPYGKGNARAVFAEKNIKVNRMSILGKDKNVLKLELLSGEGRLIEGIYFGDIEEFTNYYSEKFSSIDVENALSGLSNDLKLDIIYYPNINEFMNKKTIQVVVQGFR